MNLLSRILDRVLYMGDITLGQFIYGPVRNNEEAEFFKKLSDNDGLSPWNKTNHCPDCFDKGCAWVKEYRNCYSKIVPAHYSNYNQYYGRQSNANPIKTSKKIYSFHECQPYCKVRVEQVGTQLPLCRQYFEMNHWIPTLESSNSFT